MTWRILILIPSTLTQRRDWGFASLTRRMRSLTAWQIDELQRFYQRPGWHQTLKTFANIDEDEPAVLAETLKVISDIRMAAHFSAEVAP